MLEHDDQQEAFFFKRLFIPFTTVKAIHFIVILGIIVYANMLFNGFVIDDKTYIINNARFQAVDFFGLFRGNVFNSAGQYRPLPAIYFSTLYKMFSTSSFFYHLLELILHIVNAILVFTVFKRFFNKQTAFVLSSIFLVHPIQVESVSYIAASDNPLFFLFGIIAFCISFKNNTTWKDRVIIDSLLLVSFLTKETGFLFLFIILLYRIIFNKKQIFVFFLNGIATIAIYCLIRFGIGGVYLMKLTGVPIGNMPFIERLMNIPAMIFYYIKTLFLPVNLAVNQKWVVTKITFSSFYFPLIIDCIFFFLISAIGIFIFKKDKKAFPAFLFFFIWLLAGIGLHLQFFPLDLTVADRWFYFPFVGFLGILGLSIQTIKLQNRTIKNMAFIVVIIILTSLSAMTIVRNTNWSNNITLYSHDSTIYDDYEIENNIANEYLQEKQYNTALQHYQKSIALQPHLLNLNNIARMYDYLGKMHEAEYYYSQAILYKGPLLYQEETLRLDSYQRLAGLLLSYKLLNKADKVLVRAIHFYPLDGTLWGERAIVEYKMHNQKNALQAALKAKVLLPGNSTNDIYTKISNSQPINIPYR